MGFFDDDITRHVIQTTNAPASIWMTILPAATALIGVLIGTIGNPIISARLNKENYFSQKLWEKRIESYSGLISRLWVVSDAANYISEHYNADQQGQSPYSKTFIQKQESRLNAGEDDLKLFSSLNIIIWSEQVRNLFDEMQRRINEINGEYHWEYNDEPPYWAISKTLLSFYTDLKSETLSEIREGHTRSKKASRP